MVPDDENADALVRRNFAFIDLCGFTSLTDEHGVGEAVAALSTFRAVVRERAGWRGVRVAKWLGDGAMLVATEPRPLLDAVLRMEQALDMRGCALPLRGVAGQTKRAVTVVEPELIEILEVVADIQVGRAITIQAFDDVAECSAQGGIEP